MINRKMRRDLKKDKNLVIELYSIIQKYLPNLFDMFDNLTDLRDKRYITYKMKTICVTRLFGLLCGIASITGISEDFNTEFAISNFSKICKQNLSELPYWETIQDVFNKLSLEELRNIQKYIVKTLIRSKMFDKFKYEYDNIKYFAIAFDGTGLSNHEYNLNNTCLTRKHKDGKISYYKYVLECKLIVGNMVISLDTEFIENEKMLTENQKQDCELKAFKRMIKRIKKNYPKQKFIVIGDGLYATKPTMDKCNNYNWKWIFNLKPDRLKEINSTFEGNIKLYNESKIKNYYLSTNIEYNNMLLNAFKYITSKKKRGKKIEVIFRYISNLNVTNKNIEDTVALGRKRWKIENNGFYQQKHLTFNISHLNSRDDNGMKCHYMFIQFAHTIRQLLEKGSLLTKILKLKLKEVSATLTNTLTKSSIPNLNNLEKNFQLRFDD